MRLAIVIPGFQAGPEDWCIPAFTNLARELARNTEVEVFALRYPHQQASYRIGRVLVHALGGGALGGRRFFGASLLNLWRETLQKIREIHRARPFDAIFGIWATESGCLATWAARMLSVPSVVHIAGGELVSLPSIRYGTPAFSLPATLVKSALRHARLVTVPSSPIKSALAKSGLRSARPIRLWPLGVDTEMFSPPDLTRKSGRAFTFICAGSLIPVKGHDLLLRSFSLLTKYYQPEDVRLQLAGTGPLESSLIAMTTKLGLEGYVEFLGEVPHSDLPDIYRAADCFVIASWHEAQCMAALEAVACGIPWVGPTVGALADLPSTGHATPTGAQVAGREPQAFAEGLRTIMCLAPEEREQWGHNGRAVIERDYELTLQSARLVQMLQEL